MSMRFLKLMLVASMGMTAAACQDPGYAQRGYYQQPAPAYGNQYPNGGYAPAPARYGYAQPASTYNQADGRRYTTVNVTNRGQNGNRDDVVQQQVVCGSQYYDGYRTRTAPQC
jgi:hypothetical protein